MLDVRDATTANVFGHPGDAATGNPATVVWLAGEPPGDDALAAEAARRGTPVTVNRPRSDRSPRSRQRRCPAVRSPRQPSGSGPVGTRSTSGLYLRCKLESHCRQGFSGIEVPNVPFHPLNGYEMLRLRGKIVEISLSSTVSG